MTIKEAFMESWKRNFGEFPPPGLMFLLETTAAEALSGGKRHLSDIQLMEDDLKLCKSRIFKLRSEIRREKYCQSWLAKEIVRRRRAQEGLEELMGSDETNSIDLDSEDGLKSADDESVESDAEMIDQESQDCTEIADIPTITPVVPPRPPTRQNTLTQKTLPPQPRTPFPKHDNDSDSSGDDYENVAFVLANRESVRSLSPCTVDSRGSDTDYNNDDDVVLRSGSFGSSLEDLNITTEKKLHILSSRAGVYLPSSPQSTPQSPTGDFDKFSESSSTDAAWSAGETGQDFGE